MSSGEVTALVLAGRRQGVDDPVAAVARQTHKAFVRVGGRPMLARVVDALLAAPSVRDVVIRTDEPSLATGLPELQDALATGRVRSEAADVSPAATVLSVLRAKDVRLPLLVTTADHALLTVDIVEDFLASVPPDADVVAAVADESLLNAAYPDTVRTYIRFRGEAVTGCNLFYFRTARSAAVAAFWRDVERHRKNPVRMIRILGLWPTLRFLARRMTLAEAATRVSSRLQLDIAVTKITIPEAGIDIDKVSDLELAETILARRLKLN